MSFKKVPIVGGFLDFLMSEDMDIGLAVILFAVPFFFFGLYFTDISQAQVITFLFATAPIWLPYISFSIFFDTYMDTIGKAFYLSNGRACLEIKLPNEVFKSPEAMEQVFNQIYNKQSPDNLMETYITGKRPQNISLELVSTGGNVRFFVNTPRKKTKFAFETAIYSQYPGVEIIEHPIDYTAQIPNDLEGLFLMSFHMNKNGDQELPIKTYIDYGLDKMPKEEEKNDPMTPTLELLSAIKPYEHIWIQIIISGHRDQNFKQGQLKSAPSWEKGVYEKIDKIMKRDANTKLGDVEFEGMPRLTQGERETIEAMERNVAKTPFETNIRWLYITEQGKFNGDLVAPMLRIFSAYDMAGRNKVAARWRTDFNYTMFSDPFGKKVDGLRKQELKEYKLRKFFPKNGIGGSKVFTAEELATMFHLPGKVAMTPALNRVTSTRGEAPSNLPTGNLPI